jgi:hypothetical protein
MKRFDHDSLNEKPKDNPQDFKALYHEVLASIDEELHRTFQEEYCFFPRWYRLDF